MKIQLTVTFGPHRGKEFVFEGHDTFLVGRTKDAHFQLSYDDPYFLRRHFLVETNPPRCRLIDLNSRNGTKLNGVRVQWADVANGDEIGAGHTTFKVRVIGADANGKETLDPPGMPGPVTHTVVGQSPQSLVPGYEIEGELGRGGMGVVYRATRTQDGRPVALKTIIPAAGVAQKQIDRFLRECLILAQLDHPNIVTFLDVGEAGGLIYLVMDLVNGPDMSSTLSDCPITSGMRIMDHEDAILS